MDVKKQIGQLFVLGFQGTTPTEEYLSFVREWGIGGIIFFVRNYQEPADIKLAVERLREAAGFPQFTSIDQEGGLVLRILKEGSLFPSAMGLSATDDPGLTKSVAAALGREMLALGLNWNLAPVLDINHARNPGIGARSFGDTPERVARFGQAFQEGLREGGVLACAKHFPGKGHAQVDSHLSLPTIPYPRERLWDFELAPFRASIAAGIDAIMTAHVFFPAIEPAPNLPGTLSEAVLTGLLRHEMGFKGLLVTDDLEMGAITESFGVADAARRSFLAGADLLLICHDLGRQREAAMAILEEVHSSPKARARLEESLTRIAAARARLPHDRSGATLAELARRHEPLIREAHARSILCAPIDRSVLPLTAETPVFALCPSISALVQVEETHREEGVLPLVRKRFPRAVGAVFHPQATADEILAAAAKAGSSLGKDGRLLLFSYNAHLFPGQAAAMAELCRRYPRAIMVALRNPYDLALAKPALGIATFGFRSPAIEAALDLLEGKTEPRSGPWPINLQDATLPV